MLILVVALLMLLVLIGTAYISTSRADRASASQNAANTEVDLLVQGLMKSVQGPILQDLFTPIFHSHTYTHGDGPGSAFLAARHPRVLDNGSRAGPLDTFNAPEWPHISASPVGGGFESPYNPEGTGPLHYTTRAQNCPTSVSFSVNGVRQVYPAMQDAVTRQIYLAADADGDGIADAGLFRLPIGESGGITYYGATRVVDNAGAINASVAWEPNDSTVFPGNFFPTNVKFRYLLNAEDLPDNFASFNAYRFGGQSAPSVIPIDDAGNARGDFVFASSYDAFWSQLGRRLLNPGYNMAGVKYQALSSSDSIAMAHRFVLRDPNVATAAQSSSLLERYLPSSVFDTAPLTPYGADAVIEWFTKNLDFVHSTTTPLRSILVGRNGVTNYSPSRLTARGSWANPPAGGGTFYAFGDWVTFQNVAYVCICPTNSVPPTGDANSATCWEPQPWYAAPVKASVNTASFGQLWSAFWSVMVDPDTAAAPDKTLAGVPIVGPPPYVPPAAPISPAPTTISKIFRSSLRDPNATPTTKLVPAVQMQLRAAIAAAQTEQLRSNSFGQFATAAGAAAPSGLVYSHLVHLADPTTGATQYDVMVYGTDMQPYVVAVYANNDTTTNGSAGTPNPKGYVAIWLYNPSPNPVTLTNWNLGIVDRRASTYPSLKMVPITGFAGFSTGGPVIPGNGTVLLENYRANPSGNDATFRPTADQYRWGTPGNGYYVPNLHEVMQDASGAPAGGELYLLRPRRADGTLQTGATATNNSANAEFYDPNNPYDEANLEDLVPVDSFDFHGMVLSGAPPFTAIQYHRPYAATEPNTAWRWVYPGRWPSPDASEAPFRQQGTKHVSWGPTEASAVDPWIHTPLNLEAFGASYPSPFLAIQLGSIDAAGPHPVVGTGNQFPFGGFARNGDMLQIPYIGAYRIRVSGVNSGFLELNTVSEDSALADDLDPNDDNAENIGRFAPIHPGDLKTFQTEDADIAALYDPAKAVNDYHDAGVLPSGTGNWADKWRYHWVMGLFDFLTVTAPHDDYFPNAPINDKFGPRVDSLYRASSGAALPAYRAYDRATGTFQPVATQSPVPNGPGAVALNATGAPRNEEGAVIEGLININTAPARVLQALPMVEHSKFGWDWNKTVADEIEAFRDWDDGSTTANPRHPHGPFKNIFELNMVRTFRRSNREIGDFSMTTQDPDDLDGDLSPFNDGGPAVTDKILADFESQNLALTRISNLITTRSDSFTAYVLVQGWRGVGTDHPELVVQRRAAVILDRSHANPNNRNSPNAILPTNVPVN